MQESMLGSPLRGLEKLSEDLRQERSRASLAMQERARMRIEIESLKQTVEKQNLEIVDHKSTISRFETEKSLMNDDLVNINDKFLKDKQECQDLISENEKLKKDLLDKNNECDSLINRCAELRNQSLELETIIHSSDNKTSSKDTMIQDLQNELSHLRRVQTDSEKKIEFLSKLYDETKNQLEDCQQQNSQDSLARERLSQLQLSYADLQREYENTLQHSNDDKKKLLVVQQQNDEFKRVVSRLESETSNLRDLLAKSQHDVEILETSRDELIKHLKAEKDTSEAAQVKADVANRGKLYLERQINDLEAAHSSSLQREKQLENDLSQARKTIFENDNEIMKLKDRVQQLEGLEETARQSRQMEIELESLRTQLVEVRRQMVKRDVDEDATVLAPRAIFEREQQSRQVYESIIIELRGEIERLGARNRDYQDRLEQMSLITAKNQQLEMEVSMYKEAATMATIENQNITMSASEALDRSSRVHHDKMSLLRDVQQLESDLHTYKLEIDRLNVELEGERSKRKEMYAAKLTSDRQLAELMAGKYKIEAQLDDERQRRIFDNMESERSKKSNKEVAATLVELRQKLKDSESAYLESESRFRKLQIEHNRCVERSQDLQMTVETLQNSLETGYREQHGLEEKLSAAKDELETLTQQLRYANNEVEAIRSEKERMKRQLQNWENEKRSESLKGLRSELEVTVKDFQSSQKEKQEKDERIQLLTVDLNKERERSSLLKTQLSVTEERLQVMTQEVSLLRSMDIYRSSMNKELSSSSASQRCQQSSSSVQEHSDDYLSNSLKATNFHARNKSEVWSKNNSNMGNVTTTPLSISLSSSTSSSFPRDKPLLIESMENMSLSRNKASSRPLEKKDLSLNDRLYDKEEVESDNEEGEDTVKDTRKQDKGSRNTLHSRSVETLDGNMDDLNHKHSYQPSHYENEDDSYLSSAQEFGDRVPYESKPKKRTDALDDRHRTTTPGNLRYGNESSLNERSKVLAKERNNYNDTTEDYFYDQEKATMNDFDGYVESTEKDSYNEDDEDDNNDAVERSRNNDMHRKESPEHSSVDDEYYSNSASWNPSRKLTTSELSTSKSDGRFNAHNNEEWENSSVQSDRSEQSSSMEDYHKRKRLREQKRADDIKQELSRRWAERKSDNQSHSRPLSSSFSSSSSSTSFSLSSASNTGRSKVVSDMAGDSHSSRLQNATSNSNSSSSNSNLNNRLRSSSGSLGGDSRPSSTRPSLASSSSSSSSSSSFAAFASSKPNNPSSSSLSATVSKPKFDSFPSQSHAQSQSRHNSSIDSAMKSYSRESSIKSEFQSLSQKQENKPFLSKTSTSSSSSKLSRFDLEKAKKILSKD